MRRIGMVAFVALPLLFGACQDRGQGRAEDTVTKEPRSGGFTPEDNSAAFRPRDKNAPSGRQTRMGDLGVLTGDDAGLPAAETVPPLPRKPPPPPAPQKQTPTPHGEAGGTLRK